MLEELNKIEFSKAYINRDDSDKFNSEESENNSNSSEIDSESSSKDAPNKNINNEEIIASQNKINENIKSFKLNYKNDELKANKNKVEESSLFNKGLNNYN